MTTLTSLRDLAGRYDAILLDAFGVLVTHHGPIDGAGALVQDLRAAGQRIFVVTNDASRHPEQAAGWYRDLGIEIAPEEVISSGLMLQGWVKRRGLQGRSVAVLGTGGSRRLLEEAGAHPVDADQPFEAAALCDEEGYRLIPAVEQVLDAIRRKLRDGERLPVALANPDIVYPQTPERMGLAMGAVAVMLAAAVEATEGLSLLDWAEPLGKPYAPIFEEAARQAGSTNLLMVGDQLSTDVRGAVDFGIDSALASTGVHLGDIPAEGPQPTFRLAPWRNPAAS